MKHHRHVELFSQLCLSGGRGGLCGASATSIDVRTKHRCCTCRSMTTQIQSNKIDSFGNPILSLTVLVSQLC